MCLGRPTGLERFWGAEDFAEDDGFADGGWVAQAEQERAGGIGLAHCRGLRPGEGEGLAEGRKGSKGSKWSGRRERRGRRGRW